MTQQMIDRYLAGVLPPRNGELERMEEIAREEHFPIIGPVVGHFCYQIARLIGARSIFELGSGYGYSTAWFAQAVRENGGGIVHHTVWDKALSDRAKDHLSTLGLMEFVEFHVGEAIQALTGTEGIFDLIFMDIDKQMYPSALPVIREKLRRGGVLLVDNMFLGGRMFDPDLSNEQVEGVAELTRLIR
ncbi:MAG: O-methyltransferase, partial [Lentisphaerae bacterium]